MKLHTKWYFAILGRFCGFSQFVIEQIMGLLP